jgi:hypothetical protein
MSKELSKREKERILSQIKVRSSILGLEDYEYSNKLNIDDNYGICSSCKNFSIKKSKYSIRKAYCFADRKIKLTSDDPILECSDHDKRGSMTLEQMWALATLIDEDPKGKIGFVDDTIR